VNPDLELGSYLTNEADFGHTARLLGAMEYRRGKGEARTIGVLNGYVTNEGDAWNYTLDALGLYYESARTAIRDEEVVIPPWSEVLELVDDDPPDVIADAIGPYLDSAQLLGQRTAELHVALASGTTETFAPEAFTTLYQRSLYQSMRAQVRPTLQMLRKAMGDLEERGVADAESVLGAENAILGRFDAVRTHRFDTSRIRVHGDFHLGQVLHSGRDFVIIDFEGEPSRSPTERRIKRSPLADVAGMLRSFQYAARAGLNAHAERGLVPQDQWEAFEARERAWQMWVTIRFLAGYLETADGTLLVPPDEDDLQVLLTAYALDKALYEVRYDLGHRPDWAPIPLHGIVQLLEGRS
jgi:maltose alpha-D-glucosyltransferase/alpha-amylase